MKVFIYKTGNGQWNCYEEVIEKCFLVPNDFDEQSLTGMLSLWHTTFAPKKMFGKMTKKKYPIMPFVDFLQKKFKSIDFFENVFSKDI